MAMKKEGKKQAVVPERISEGSEAEKFSGYTMEDLRYQRALVALKREYSKESVMLGMNKLYKRGVNPLSDKNGSSLMKASGVAGKIISGLNYVDYILLGISAFTTLRKITGFFTRGKK